MRLPKAVASGLHPQDKHLLMLCQLDVVVVVAVVVVVVGCWLLLLLLL